MLGLRSQIVVGQIGIAPALHREHAGCELTWRARQRWFFRARHAAAVYPRVGWAAVACDVLKEGADRQRPTGGEEMPRIRRAVRGNSQAGEAARGQRSQPDRREGGEAT